MDNSQTNLNQNEDPMIGRLIFDRYKLIKKLGSGSFGSIYSAEYNNKKFAIKLEEKNKGQNLLENEAYIMSYLRGPGLPYVKSYGYSNKHNILVMELMGKSLEDIFEDFIVKKMSTRCVCNIGYQMIEILEYIHNKHVIHRDIKPDNFVVGLNEKKKYIYILDFGLSKKYRSSRTLKHYQIVKNKNLTGTARYASINALNGLTQSRRDDLEAIGYVLMYFLRGRLPWQGIPVKNKEDRYRKIMEKKIATSAEELCQGFPNEFAEYVNYTRNLEYEQDPDYIYLRNLFLKVLNREGYGIDCFYDWDKETINYFRDFKNVDKNSNNNNKSNKSRTDTSSLSTNQQFNMKEVNSYNSFGEKPFIRFNNNSNFNSNFNSNINSNINSSNKYLTSNMALASYHLGKTNVITNSGNNGDNSALPQKKNEPESLYSNQIVKDYIKSSNNNNNNQNNINNRENINDSNLLNEKKKIENDKNLEEEKIKNSFVENNNTEEVKEKNNEQKKGFYPRPEKDNKCCLIF